MVLCLTMLPSVDIGVCGEALSDNNIVMNPCISLLMFYVCVCVGQGC